VSKTLLIMRHAKSSWRDAGLADHLRPLTGRGKRDAELMGRALVRRGLSPDLVLTSTAKRARATARRLMAQPGILAERVEDGRLYESSPRRCLRTLAARGSGDTVLLIGHNPTFEELVYALTSRHVALPTATVAVVRLPINDWAELSDDTRGQLLALFAPRDVRAEGALPGVGGAPEQEDADECD